MKDKTNEKTLIHHTSQISNDNIYVLDQLTSLKKQIDELYRLMAREIHLLSLERRVLGLESRVLELEGLYRGYDDEENSAESEV